MLRHIATTALVIGSAAALLIGSSTYAPFTGDAGATGAVGAGTVQVEINGTDTHTFAFNTAECANMAPGVPCTESFAVGTGGSSLSATWDLVVSDDDEPLPDLPDGCFTESVDGLSPGDVEDGDPHEDHDGDGHTHDATLIVNVADDNRCQGAASNVTVTVTATQSPSPHN